jgi:hypothetical protein
VKVTLDGMLSAITTWGDQEEVAPVTKGVQQLMDTGFSIWSAWNSVANPQPSIRDSLHNDMVQMQDYLVCKVDSIVRQSTTDIEKTIIQVRHCQQCKCFC